MDESDNGRSVALAVRQVSAALADVMRSEVRLAKAELKDTGSKLGQHAMKIGICAALVVLGAFPAMAFLVIGLGKILGGNYWLSSLIFAVLFTAIGGALGLGAFRRLREEDHLLPEVRTTLANEAEGVRRKLRQFTSSAENENENEKRKAG